MFKNAFKYVTRKSAKSVILFLVVLIMSSLCLVGLSIKDATNKASNTSLGSITNSFTMEINRQVNFGTPRGAGNVKGKDIEKICASKDIDSYVKRINSVADLVNHDIVLTSNENKERLSKFKSTVMLTGVNESKKETKFVSQAYKLVEGKHLNSNDKHQILMHKDLAKKNHLKVGDTICLNSHTYTIKGIFEGKKHETYTGLSSDLSENTVFVDYHSLDTKMIHKMTVFSKNESMLKQVHSLYPSSEYVVSKDTNAYKSSLESIQSMKHMIQILSCSIIVCGLVVLSLVLVLWLRDRMHEIGVLLSIGKSKMEIIVQFILELVFISFPSEIILCAFSVMKHNTLCFILSYGLLMSIIIVSVLMASLMIMIKKPREILSKLS